MNTRLYHASMNKLSFALLALITSLAQAGTVQITVTDKDGKPVPDVVVLLQHTVKTAPSPAPRPVQITQEGSRFVPYLSVVSVGSTLRFTNKDGYDHHVRSTPTGPLGSVPPAKSFELRLDANAAAVAAASNDIYPSYPARSSSGNSSADVKLDAPGAIGLGCHIHGSMRGHVYVAETPWFAKTDASGVASIGGIPDGAGQLVLWHPDQLQAQTPVPVQVSTAPVNAAAQLNFTPRRRRN